MKRLIKLFALIAALCLLATPAVSSAAYDPQYATGSDYIFADNLWTSFEELSISGATYAYHAQYDSGDGVLADYYAVYYPTYTDEWLNYSNTSGYEGWANSATTDGTSTYNNEYFDYYNSDLWYEVYNDGSTYNYSWNYSSDQDAYNPDYYYYSIDQETYADGSYYYDWYYSSYDLQWEYYSQYDVSNASQNTYSRLYDPANGTESNNYSWESTATGSYGNSYYNGAGTATKSGDYWTFAYDTQEYYSESFSADYSSFNSGYEFDTYSTAGDTYYSTSYMQITDTPYYYTSSSWENNIDNSYQYSDEGVLPSWNGSDSDWQVSYYEASQPDSYYYSSSFEENLVTGEFYTDEDSQWYSGDLKGYEKYTESYYDIASGESYDEVYYQYDNTTAKQYWYNDVYSYSYDNGNYSTYQEEFYSDYTGKDNYNQGTGTYTYTDQYYNSAIQETDTDYFYGQFVARPASETNPSQAYYYNYTYEYGAYSMTLADSDEASSNWYQWVRNPSPMPTNYSYYYDPISYESYATSLDSDTRGQYSEYYQVTYKPVGATWDYYPAYASWYYEDDWQNLASGAYENYKDYRTNGQTYYYSNSNYDGYDYRETSGVGQDTVSYYQYGSIDDTIANTYYDYDYSYTLANGAQYYTVDYSDYNTSVYSYLRLINPTGAAWTGYMVVDANSGMGPFDVYYYAQYPDDYILTSQMYVNSNLY